MFVAYKHHVQVTVRGVFVAPVLKIVNISHFIIRLVDGGCGGDMMDVYHTLCEYRLHA